MSWHGVTRKHIGMEGPVEFGSALKVAEFFPNYRMSNTSTLFALSPCPKNGPVVHNFGEESDSNHVTHK